MLWLKHTSLHILKGTLQNEPLGELKMKNSHSTDYATDTGQKSWYSEYIMGWKTKES